MLAIISDIHANTEALTAVLDDIASRGASQTICLGDVIGYGADPEVCLDTVGQSPRAAGRGRSWSRRRTRRVATGGGTSWATWRSST